MPVHVDTVLTEVTADAEPPAPAAAPESPWADADRLRAALAELDRNRARTRAGGFDD